MATTVEHPANYMEGTVLRDDLARIVQTQDPVVRDAVRDWAAVTRIDQVYLVGCGGSLATFRPIQLLLEQHGRIPATTLTGWEFVNRAPARLGPASVVVLASHSGTTEEILAGLALARERGARTIGFSLEGTPLAEGVDVAATYLSIAANLSKLLLGYLVAVGLLEADGDAAVAAELREALAGIPGLVHRTKEATRQFGWGLAKRYREAKLFYVLGTGPLEGLAYQFAICNLLEMHWVHAAALNAAEFPHGPLEIVDEGIPIIVLLGTDASRFVAERARDFAVRHGADVISIDLADLPGFHPLLAPFGAHLPLQWFNWYLGIEKDRPISTRRYMGIRPYAANGST